MSAGSDGIGGSSGPIGWQAAGALDGEVACLAGEYTKTMLFHGGVTTIAESGRVNSMYTTSLAPIGRVVCVDPASLGWKMKSSRPDGWGAGPEDTVHVRVAVSACARIAGSRTHGVGSTTVTVTTTQNID